MIAAMIDFQTDPSRWRHWRIETDGPVAWLVMDVDERGGIVGDYELKLNSYDLGVDIELADAVQRLRFEHPEVRAVILRSGKEGVFCAGANIRMLAAASHADKVNFCKFTNETRNAIEEAGAHSGQSWIAAVAGTCAGGGYELALATDHIILADDGASAVALPEAPLLGVLPGTGGVTRVTDKRKVRRDLADLFCTLEEGVRGARAEAWRLVDETAPLSGLKEAATARAAALAEASDRPAGAEGVSLGPLDREITEDSVRYSTVAVACDRAARTATVTVFGPDASSGAEGGAASDDALPASPEAMQEAGDQFWPLRAARELDDAILHLRFNETQLGVIRFRTEGDPAAVAAHSAFLEDNAGHWLAREIQLLWRRLLKRIDMTSRSLVALIEPGSCYAGMLAELAFAADRSFMALGRFEGDNRPEAALALTAENFGRHPMGNGLTRLETRFLGDPDALARIGEATASGTPVKAEEAEALGLVTAACDDIDWEDEVRIFTEERASFSPDAMTALEANLRFAGPETMETKIFARLSAWQNWIFQRPNATGEEGALKRYGSGRKPAFDPGRV